MDNVFIETPWKSVKCEEVYIKAYDSIAVARRRLTNWSNRYNIRRRHQGLDNRPPDEVHWTTLPRMKRAV
jgi:putative transposase